VVGVPEFGVEAASSFGIDLERLVLVPNPGDQWLAVTAAIADGIRTSLRFDAARQASDSSAPGLMVLSASNDVELITPAAQELLAAMSSPALAPVPS